MLEAYYLITITLFNFMISFGTAFNWLSNQIHWTVQILIPDACKYWLTRARLHHRYSTLSWKWWILLFASFWNEPSLKPGKQFNGTWWMHVRADQYELLSEFKELQRSHKELQRSHKYSNRLNTFADLCELTWKIHSDLWHTALMLMLNFVGVGYFIYHIALFKCGYIAMASKKREWYKHRKKKQTFQVHTTVLNIDKQIQDQSISFDTDSSTIICDNSANVHICTNRSMFISPP